MGHDESSFGSDSVDWSQSRNVLKIKSKSKGPDPFVSQGLPYTTLFYGPKPAVKVHSPGRHGWGPLGFARRKSAPTSRYQS